MSRAVQAAQVASLLLASSLGSGCFYFVDEAGPWIRSADAFCTDRNSWQLEAEVTHPGGGREIADVWVEVTETWWDSWSGVTVSTYLGDVLLGPEGGDWWGGEVRSRRDFLDCGWAGDYELSFVAEDFSGDTDIITLLR